MDELLALMGRAANRLNGREDYELASEIEAQIEKLRDGYVLYQP